MTGCVWFPVNFIGLNRPNSSEYGSTHAWRGVAGLQISFFLMILLPVECISLLNGIS
jgi:hypothetical protein